jgi:hypothetical protein
MNGETIAGIVARLYESVGRKASDLTYEVWHEQLAPLLDDELGVVTARQLVGTVDNNGFPVTPAQFRQHYHRLASRRPALPPVEGRIPPVAEAKANIARLRDLLGEHPIKRPEDGRC